MKNLSRQQNIHITKQTNNRMIVHNMSRQEKNLVKDAVLELKLVNKKQIMFTHS